MELSDEMVAKIIQIVLGGVGLNLVLYVLGMTGQYKLFSWRLGKLEAKVERHNRFGERLATIEGRCERREGRD
jgi:hypothetical protein